MKIKYVVPWIPDEALKEYERPYLADDIEVVGSDEKGILGECPNDISHMLPDLIDCFVKAETEKYSAAVGACHVDAGVEEARESVDIPILGPLRVGLHIAGMLGHKICVLIPEYSRMHWEEWRKVVEYGFENRAVIRGSREPVSSALQAYRDYHTNGKIGPFITEMTDICIKSIVEDDADIIVLGGGPVKWMKEVLENELLKKGYGITVINALTVTFETARMLARLGLTHSKVGYPKPPGEDDRYTEQDLTFSG